MDDSNNRWPTRLICAGLALAVAAACRPLRHGGFVAVDDYDYVVNNDAIQHGLNWRAIAWAFTTTHAGHWHPLAWIFSILQAAHSFAHEKTPRKKKSLAIKTLQQVLDRLKCEPTDTNVSKSLCWPSDRLPI